MQTQRQTRFQYAAPGYLAQLHTCCHDSMIDHERVLNFVPTLAKQPSQLAFGWGIIIGSIGGGRSPCVTYRTSEARVAGSLIQNEHQQQKRTTRLFELGQENAVLNAEAQSSCCSSVPYALPTAGKHENSHVAVSLRGRPEWEKKRREVQRVADQIPACNGSENKQTPSAKLTSQTLYPKPWTVRKPSSK